MKYTLLIKEEADLEIAEAYKWHEDKSKFLGEEFLIELDEYFSFLENNPYSCQVRYKSYRLFPLKRFHYMIVYEIENENVIVYSVFHMSKDPKKRYEE